VPAILPFRYPDGTHDAEALVVDPGTARVFVITKSLFSLGNVYRIDGLGSREGGTAVRVRTLKAPREFDSTTTAADAHPTRTRRPARPPPAAADVPPRLGAAEPRRPRLRGRPRRRARRRAGAAAAPGRGHRLHGRRTRLPARGRGRGQPALPRHVCRTVILSG